MSSFAFGSYLSWDPTCAIAGASNVQTSSNPAFVSSDFLSFYPQFTGLLPDPVLTQFIGMANATVQQWRWQDSWKYGMCLFIAHFSTLYLQTASDPIADQVIEAAQSRGLVTGESVSDLSFSQDFSMITSGLEGWANWISTEYGKQFATMARMLGKAGMLIW